VRQGRAVAPIGSAHAAETRESGVPLECLNVTVRLLTPNNTRESTVP
jgi:hypothetical protein